MELEEPKRYTTWSNVAASIFYLVCGVWWGCSSFFAQTLKSSDITEFMGVVSERPAIFYYNKSGRELRFRMQHVKGGFYLNTYAYSALSATALFCDEVNVGDTLILGIMNDTYYSHIVQRAGPDALAGKSIEVRTVRAKDRAFVTLSSFNAARLKDLRLGILVGPCIIAYVLWSWWRKRRLDEIKPLLGITLIALAFATYYLWNRFYFPG